MILVNPFQDYKEKNDLFGNIFDETRACNSSSFDGIINTNLFFDLERKEVIFGNPLYFDCNDKIKGEQINTLGNNVNVVDTRELHRKVMVMSSPHAINSYLEPS